MKIIDATSTHDSMLHFHFPSLSPSTALDESFSWERDDAALCRDFLEAASFYSGRFRLSPGDADEYRQDLIAAVLPAARRRFRDGTYNKTYVYQCARHHLHDCWRAKAKKRASEMLACEWAMDAYTSFAEQIACPNPTPEEASEINELWRRLEMELTPGQRRFFMPHYRHSVPVETLAAKFKCTTNEIHQELHKARVRIKSRIREADLRLALSPKAHRHRGPARFVDGRGREADQA